MIRKLLALALALGLVAAANVRTVYEVSVEGRPLEGTYSALQLERARSLASLAAEEIARGETELPEHEAGKRLSLHCADGDFAALTSALLTNAAGVDEVWEVSVAGGAVGMCDDPSALGEVLEVMLYNGASREAVCVEFTDEITLRRLLAPEGREYDLMELSAALRGATEVMSVTAGGTVRYG